jgi:hypothetical protein
MHKVVADNRARVVELIRATAASLGTPADLAERVIERMRPSIRLVPREGRVELGSESKVGGEPDLPEGMDWPLLCPEDGDDSPPMWFLLQVNLADVAPWDVEGLLPTSGLLSVFLNWDEEYFDEEPYLLVHVFGPDGPPLQRVEFHEALPEVGRFREAALEARPEWTIPSPEDAGETPWYESRHLRLWSALDSEVFELQGNPGRIGSTHRLLGHPQLIQSPGVADGARLFLQIDSDDRRSEESAKIGMNWGDQGRLYVMLNEPDLRAGRWDKIWSFAETC